jgi:maltose alpha-D-glucosyltransferase / alpha-amylase
MPDYWWKNAIIYAIDVERFCDGNGDGCGDFEGLTSKVPYLSDLGITCIWLLPFYPSSDRDNGYDIVDYFRVDPRYGQFEDFLKFVRVAGEQSIRIIIDLVTHHTSDKHPWFQSARHDAVSPFRDYYVWTDHPPPTPDGKGTMFPGQEDSVWTFDEIARKYYYHRFYSFQPGLNHQNPAVRDEVERIIDFWMSFGISGFRLDAASHMIERPLDPEGRVDESHAVLRHIYKHVTNRKADAMLLGEVDEDEHHLKRFFDGEQMNMMFNFFLNNYLILALATEQAEPVRQAVMRLPPPPDNGQWANFLRNLDEADLERLTPQEMEAVFSAFAPREEMRIYGRGIRRRLAPMLEGDAARLKLAWSLLFSLPGAPVVCYGDEIGMGEDLSLDGRNSVRTPMQWTAGRNGGFSKCQKLNLVEPVIAEGKFGFPKVNVEAQVDDENSLLCFIKKLALVRRGHPSIGRHDCRFLSSGSDHVLAHGYDSRDHDLLMLHNLSGNPIKLDLELDVALSGDPVELLGKDVGPPNDKRLHVDLEPYGMRWLKWTR